MVNADLSVLLAEDDDGGEEPWWHVEYGLAGSSSGHEGSAPTPGELVDDVLGLRTKAQNATGPARADRVVGA